VRLNGYFITLWNIGGWIVPSDVFSPDAYVMYLTEEQTRYSRKLIPDVFKIVAKPEKGPGDGDYDRKILKKRLAMVGK